MNPKIRRSQDRYKHSTEEHHKGDVHQEKTTANDANNVVNAMQVPLRKERERHPYRHA
jgi:hypothetical protein